MLRYSAGDWYAIVTERGLALLAADVPLEVVESIWSALSRDQAGLGVVLEGLVGTFGTSLASLPSFAVVSAEGETDTRVIVRGGVTAHALLSDGSARQVSGLGVTTWQEQVVSDAAVVELVAPGASDAVLPIERGVVRAGSVRWQRGAVAPVAVVTPEPGPASEPVPGVAATSPLPPAALQPAPLMVDETPSLTSATAPPALDAASAEETISPDLGATATALPDDTFSTIADESTTDETASDSPEDHTHSYDDLLFGATRMSTVEDAAVRASADAPGLIQGLPSSPSSPALVGAGLEDGGDHDGETVSLAQLAEIQVRLGLDVPMAPTPEPVGATWPILVVSTGEHVVLDRPAVVGRRPRAVRATGTVPHLVAVESPNQDVSRNHLELRPEGRDVVALDLNTMNGTHVLRDGVDPVRLQPGEPTLIVHGDQLDLGDGIVLSFEGLR